MPDLYELGPRILQTETVPGPPVGPWARHTAYPLALDIDGELGAVSFAMLDMYPHIALGWWCLSTTWMRDGDRWEQAGNEVDNGTSPEPFARPVASTNSFEGWCDWHTNGGAVGGSPDARYPWLHTFFGIAPISTARLTVTDETGRERDLRITPWNGAYVAVVAGLHSTLTGYGDDGRLRGSFMPMDGLTDPEDEEPPPGWERVDELPPGWEVNDNAGPVFWQRKI